MQYVEQRQLEVLNIAPGIRHLSKFDLAAHMVTRGKVSQIAEALADAAIGMARTFPETEPAHHAWRRSAQRFLDLARTQENDSHYGG